MSKKAQRRRALLKEIVLLTDILPYELPITFSNRNLLTFILRHNLNVHNETLSWTNSSSATNILCSFLFGLWPNNSISLAEKEQAGLSTIRYHLPTREKSWETVPFCFGIAHKGIKDRRLSVMHPRNQVLFTDFLDRFGATILEVCKLDSFSLRSPVRQAKHYFHEDELNALRSKDMSASVEQDSYEYRNYHSYFVYSKFNRLYRFFESTILVNAERKYRFFLTTDIQDCFQSIYTHSLSWCMYGKDFSKEHLHSIESSFPAVFDRLMQKCNYNETNGILVGPEVSRVFAEILLQHIDREVVRRLTEGGKLRGRHYDVFRYIDDYFIFALSSEDGWYIRQIIEDCLQFVNLRLQTKESEKTHVQLDPMFNSLQEAKLRASALMIRTVSTLVHSLSVVQEQGTQESSSEEKLTLSSLVHEYKAILALNSVEYSDIVNYSLVLIEGRTAGIPDLIRSNSQRSAKHLQTFVDRAQILVEFIMYLYTKCDRVSETIKLCTILAHLIESIRLPVFSMGQRHAVYRCIEYGILERLSSSSGKTGLKVEHLYLLIILAEFDKGFRIPEHTLTEYIGLTNYSDIGYGVTHLNYLALTVLMYYVKSYPEYSALRGYLIKVIRTKLRDCRSIGKSSENTMLLLDFIVCPFLSIVERKAIVREHLRVSDDSVANEIANMRSFWFTRWTGLKLRKELESKRSRDVY